LVDYLTEAELEAIEADLEEADRVRAEWELVGWATVVICEFAAGSPG